MSRMNKLTLSLILAATTALTVACPPPVPPGAVYVRVAPPPPIPEVLLTSPGPDFVWVRGYQRWDGTTFVWVPGNWQRAPRARAVWRDGHWKHARHGWYWVEGHWR